jgi:hypothetical protein
VLSKWVLREMSYTLGNYICDGCDKEFHQPAFISLGNIELNGKEIRKNGGRLFGVDFCSYECMHSNLMETITGEMLKQNKQNAV